VFIELDNFLESRSFEVYFNESESNSLAFKASCSEIRYPLKASLFFKKSKFLLRDWSSYS